MSWQPTNDPVPGDGSSCDAIEQVIVPRARDLGGFEVRRALPAAHRQMVGPFIFFDQMGPAEFLIGPDGRVLAVKYGRVVDDHWPVDELLSLARPR